MPLARRPSRLWICVWACFLDRPTAFSPKFRTRYIDGTRAGNNHVSVADDVIDSQQGSSILTGRRHGDPGTNSHRSSGAAKHNKCGQLSYTTAKQTSRLLTVVCVSITCCIRAVNWYQNLRPWMTLNGHYAFYCTLSEIFLANHERLKDSRLIFAATMFLLIQIWELCGHLQWFPGEGALNDSEMVENGDFSAFGRCPFGTVTNESESIFGDNIVSHWLYTDPKHMTVNDLSWPFVVCLRPIAALCGYDARFRRYFPPIFFVPVRASLLWIHMSVCPAWSHEGDLNTKKATDGKKTLSRVHAEPRSRRRI